MIGDIQKGGVQTSFIPKKPLVSYGQKEGAGIGGILNLISIILFIAALSVYGGAQFYKSTLNSSIAKIKADLTIKQKQLQDKDSLMKEMIRFDTKLKNIGYLLDNHVSLRKLFSILKDSTMKNLRYNDFAYLNKNNEQIDLKLGGEALSYSTIAQQAQVLVESKRTGDKDFSNVIFSDLNPGLTGNVVFKATANMKPDLIFYRNLDSIRGI